MQQIKLITDTVINPMPRYFIYGIETFPAVPPLQALVLQWYLNKMKPNT